MRTSLNNLKAIEDYLLGHNAAEDAAVFEANMLLDSNLADDVQQQQNTYTVIRQYGRQTLKAEIAAIQQKLSTEPRYHSFWQSVVNLFKND